MEFIFGIITNILVSVVKSVLALSIFDFIFFVFLSSTNGCIVLIDELVIEVNEFLKIFNLSIHEIINAFIESLLTG